MPYSVMLRNATRYLVVWLVFAVQAPRSLAAIEATAPAARPVEGLARLPLSFERNDGQFDPRVKFLARGPGYAMWLTAHEAVVSVANDGDARPATFRMRMIGGRADAVVIPEQAIASKTHYLRGNDPAGWHSDVAQFGKVRYAGVYPGIDVVYYGNQTQLEYDVVLAPGADPSQVRFAFADAPAVSIDAEGDLLVGAAERLRLHKPIAYQDDHGKRRPVAARYEIGPAGEISFRLGAYNRRKTLVIDPVLTYSTYLGGTGTDFAQGIAVDTDGSVLVCGYTLSADFPTASPRQGSFAGSQDAFVAKLNPSGNALVYSTFIGGSGLDAANSVAVDADGNAYVTGLTASTNFPVASPLQSSNRGGTDAFVLKLNRAGSVLAYSTYLGGSGDDVGYYRLAVDREGNAHVTGTTTSADFPLANAVQSSMRGASDYFVAKVNAAGSALVYSTFLGGSGEEASLGTGVTGLGNGIAVDLAGNAYVTGATSSADFPVLNPLKTLQPGACPAGMCPDAFLTKLSPSGSLVYSTFLGGSFADVGFVVAVDAGGSAYVVGATGSTDFPLRGAFQSTLGGLADGFVTKIDPAGATIVYSTLLGGSGPDFAEDVALDNQGNAYVTGFTQSSDFPTRDAFQSTYGGQRIGLFQGDAFVTKLNNSGNALVFSSYLGGSGDEFGAIAVDPSGNAYLAGNTSSSDFPTANALQGSNRGGSDIFIGGDAFVTKVGSGSGALQERRR